MRFRTVAQANPKLRWPAKYGYKGEPLRERHIALFGKQILEGMACALPFPPAVTSGLLLNPLTAATESLGTTLWR